MTTEEAKQRRIDLEAEIHRLVSEFHAETGAKVTSVNVSLHEARETMQGEPVATCYTVRVAAEL